MAAYALTNRCRHGHINAYLGGRAIDQCGACDNCIDLPALSPLDLPDERAQLLTILKCLFNAPWGGWGRWTLVRILRGNPGWRGRDRPLNSRAREQDEFGALAFCSQAGIGRLIDRLLQSSFLQERQLDNGGTVIELTPAGKEALQKPSMLDDLLTPSPLQAATPSAPRKRASTTQPAAARTDGADQEIDKALFDKLRTWRRTQAQKEHVPPYHIFHDSHLRAIASHRPTTLEALSQIKGVGQVRLSKYGAQVLEITIAYLGG
jgi:ATP-dependent DNA helicase RecQ